MLRIQRQRVGLVAAICILMLPVAVTNSACAGEKPRAASLLAFSDDGQLLACSNRDNGTVTILSWPELTVRHEVHVGRHPEGITFLPDSRQLVCCVYGDDTVAVIDAEQGVVTRNVDVFDEPYAAVPSVDGRSVYVTLEYPGEIIRIDCASWKQTATWPVGSMLRGLAAAGDGRSLLATEYLTARLLQVSTDDGRILRTWEPASTDNLARQVIISPSGRKAWLTHIRSRITAAHGNGSIFPYVSAVTLAEGDAGRRVRIPMDTFVGARVTANPWDCDVTSDGKRMCIVFAGTNEMYVARVLEDEFQELEYESTVALGNNPRAVRVAPDDSSCVVYNVLDFELVVLSLPDGKELKRTKVCKNPLTDEVLLGKALFYTAVQPMSSRKWISCSSCHPDGHADGRTWQQPEGLRSTQPLAGLAHTHPLHWSADRDEVQDFEHTIRGALMQGRGLMRGELPDALGDAITGRSEPLDALAAYTNSHTFPLSPHAKNGLSDAALRGQQLFYSPQTRCAECHRGPYFTDSRPGPADELIRHDVGTGRSDASELMGFAYDTPTLLGVYRSAPYLHDGSAATLRDVLTTGNPDDQHGRTSHLSSDQVDDLVEFLRALPFEDPATTEEQSALTPDRNQAIDVPIVR